MSRPRKNHKLILLVIFVLIVTIIFVLYAYNKTALPLKNSLSLKATGFGKMSDKQTNAILLALPSADNFNVGDIVDVSLLVNTADQPINAIAGSITFPGDKLEVASTSKSNSIISLWIQEPFVSDTRDEINFSGVLVTPGFVGKSGQVLNVSFKVKDVGTATIGIKDAQVLASDGMGTSILDNIIPANLTLLSNTPKRDKYDFNRDGKVDLADISIFIIHLGSNDAQFDFDGDHKVSIKDLSILVSRFGAK